MYNILATSTGLIIGKKVVPSHSIFHQTSCFSHVFVRVVLLLQVTEDQMDLVDKFFAAHKYIQGSYDQAEDFQKLNREILKLVKPSACINRLFYLALPPSVYESVATNLHSHCMAKGLVIVNDLVI